jgi:hypothetical protein
MTQPYLIFTLSFETWSAFRVLGRFRKVFTVEIEQELAKHCQDKDARFDRLMSLCKWLLNLLI